MHGIARGLTAGMAGVVAGAMIAVTAPSAAAQDPNPLLPLVELAADGLQAADQMAVATWIEGSPVRDEALYNSMRQEAVKYAQNQGADVGLVERVINDQIDAMQAVQYQNFSNWEIDPAAAPTTGPPLKVAKASMNTVTSDITKGILDSAAARQTQRAQCTANLEGARISTRAVRGLRPALNPFLNYATRSLC